MASDKVNFPEVGSIAQAMKYQIRAGTFWDDLTPAAKESLDQIATCIARTVVGDGAHWDAIIGFAQAAKPTTAEPNPLRPQVESTLPGGIHRETILAQRPPVAIYPPTPAQRAGLEAIERSMREIPHREDQP
jgi:hypothetical protein